FTRSPVSICVVCARCGVPHSFPTRRSSDLQELRDELGHEAWLREYYLTWSADAFEIRVGRQQQAWGRADYFRVVDVLNPLDLREDRKSTRLNSSHVKSSYAVFCLNKKRVKS